MDLALNNLQRLICHKIQQTEPNQTITLKFLFVFLEIKFLTILQIIPFAMDTIDKIWLSALNESLKSTPR